MCVLSLICVYVAVCRFGAVRCVIIDRFYLLLSNYSTYVILNYFYVCFLVLYVNFLYFVVCFLIVMCIVSPFVDSCLFLIFVRVYWPLHPGGIQFAINKYHIISYHISYNISYHIMSDRIISYHSNIVSYHIISYHIISYHIISYHIISYHIISYHIIISHHIIYIISYHNISIISYHIISISYISYHTVSYRISYHIISYSQRLFLKTLSNSVLPVNCQTVSYRNNSKHKHHRLVLYISVLTTLNFERKEEG